MDYSKIPWKKVKIDENEDIIISNGRKIATLNHPHWDGESEANGRLMVASPKLYEQLKINESALRVVLNLLNKIGASQIFIDSLKETIKDTESVIAKAEKG